MAGSVAKVSALDGQAWAKAPNGTLRPLSVGDTVAADEVVVTASGAHIELDFGDGHPVTIAGGQEVTMDQSLWADSTSDAKDASVQDSSVQEALTVLNNGGDLTDQLDETAAGLTGGAANEGHSFVQLTRVVELLSPAAFSSDTSFNSSSPDAQQFSQALPVNHAPDAPPQSFSGDEDTTITGHIQATDVENDTLTYSLVSQTANGSITLDAATGNFVYVPKANYNGGDSFVVTVSDGHGNTTTTTISLTVNPVNDPPVSADQSLTTPEDTPIAGQVVATDVDGDTLAYSISTTATHGSVTLDPVTGNFVYTPSANYNGADEFVVTISDGHGGTTTSTIHIGVTPVNDAPVSSDQNLTTPEDTPISGQVVATDVDGDKLTYTIANATTHGAVTLDPATGGFTYTPNTNYNGPDEFVVTISDGHGGTTTSTIHIGVTPVNDPPVSSDQNLTTPEDTAINGAVVASDVDGDTLAYSINTTAAHGAVTLDPASGAFVYTPGAGFTGSDSFVVLVSDGQGGTTTSTIHIGVTPVNHAPVAIHDNATTDESTAITVAVRSNDSDPDGDALTVTSVTQGANGSVVIDAVTGNPIYTPHAGFTGADTFSYAISDGNGGTSSATVTVTVNAVTPAPAPLPVNHAPVAVNDSATTDENTSITVAVRSNDTDADSDPLTVSSVTQGSNGSVVIDAVTGNPTYTPNAGYTGSDSFTYTISDGHGGTSSATVSVTVNAVAPANHAPVANDDSFTVVHDQSITITPASLLANDTDADSDTLTVDSISNIAHGTVALVGGNFVFTPDSGYTGAASFTYTISDGHGGTASATVNLNVLPPAGTVTLDATPTLTEAGGNLVYTATLAHTQGSDVTVHLTNGEVITIAAGQVNGSVTVPQSSSDDVYVDPTHITNSISSISGGDAGLTYSSATVSTAITDTIDNTTLDLSASASVAEGGNIIYTATLSNPTQGALTVTLSNGAVITIADGASSGTISVAAPANDPYISATTISATISSTSGGNFEQLSVNATPAATSITDVTDVTNVTLSAASSVIEGGSLVYTATVDNAVTGAPLVLHLSNGADITIPVGATSANSAAVVVSADDPYAQGSQTVTVSIASTSGGNYEALDTSSTVNTTVTDNSSVTNVTLTAASNVNEGGSIVYTATVDSSVTGTPLVLHLSNGVDITIPVGASSANSAAVAVRADDAYTQGNQIVSVGISGTSGGNYETLNTSSTVNTTVSDNGTVSHITLTAASNVNEGGSIIYTATVDNSVTGTPLVLHLSNGVDITIPVGSSSADSAAVAVRADDAYTQGSQIVSVGITGTSGGNYEALDTSSTVNTTVSDNGSVTNVTLTAASNVNEGGSIVYTATVDNSVTGTPLVLHLSNGVDITIPVGASNANSAAVAVRADDAYTQGNQIISVGINGASGGNYEALNTSSTVNTTVSDNGTVSHVTLTAASNVNEGGSIVYTATIDNSVTGTPLVLHLSNGVDITIPVGATSANSAAVAVRADDAYTQGNQIVSVGITGTSGGNYEALDTSSTSSTTVTDNNTVTNLSLSGAASITEGASGAYTLTLTNPAQSDVTVNLSYSGTAIDGTDFTGVASVTVAANTNTANFNIAALTDLLTEGTENFTVSIASVSGGGFENLQINGAANSVTTSIIDVPANQAPVAVNDPSGAAYSVTLGDASASDLWTTTDSKGLSVTITPYAIDGSVSTLWQGTVDGNTNVIGAGGHSPRALASQQVYQQIEYDQATGKSEAIVLNFNGNLNQASFAVSRLFPGENGGEVGMWVAYYKGTLVASSSFHLTGTLDHGSFTIDTGSKVFDSIKFIALNTIDSTGDGGDYFLTSFSGSGPSSANTNYTLAEGSSLTVNSASSLKLLSNDTDADHDTLSLTQINGANVTDGQSVTLASGATLVIHSDGSFGYSTGHAFDSLSAGQVTTDSFTYTVSDGHGGTATATATMTIIGKDLTGTSGADTLIGGSYAEQIVGGAGNDVMTGGLGADTFTWSLNDQGSKASPATDTITDFNVAQGDALNLKDLLVNENSGNLTNYLHFTSDGTNTTIQVSNTGTFDGSNYGTETNQVIVLQGVDLHGGDAAIITQLKNNGNLITD